LRVLRHSWLWYFKSKPSDLWCWAMLW